MVPGPTAVTPGLTDPVATFAFSIHDGHLTVVRDFPGPVHALDLYLDMARTGDVMIVTQAPGGKVTHHKLVHLDVVATVEDP